MRLRHSAWGLWLATSVVCASPAAMAQDPVHAFGRGAVNVLTGWVELPRQSIEAANAHGLPGVLGGFWKGSRRFVLRTWLGATEVLMAPLAWRAEASTPYERHEIPDYPWQ